MINLRVNRFKAEISCLLKIDEKEKKCLEIIKTTAV
jgi:hypothetical protein